MTVYLFQTYTNSIHVQPKKVYTNLQFINKQIQATFYLHKKLFHLTLFCKKRILQSDTICLVRDGVYLRKDLVKLIRKMFITILNLLLLIRNKLLSISMLENNM